MIRRWLMLAAAWTLGWAPPALAWGELGHRTVAEIAMANVSPQTAARVAELLRAEPELVTPSCPLRSLSDAAIWPDCVRAEGWRWSYTYPWHFQDAPVCATLFDPKADCAYGNCVTAQIERTRRILGDRALSAAERLEALAFLAHFVGDVHQPLHAADNGDAGGNAVVVSNIPPEPVVINAAPHPIVVNPVPQPISLHWFWDTILVRRAFAEVPAATLVHRYSPAERDAIATGDAADWARESWELARKLVYPQAFGRVPCAGAEPKVATISDAQAEQDLPVVRQRIQQAGLRLAKLLDAALGG